MCRRFNSIAGDNANLYLDSLPDSQLVIDQAKLDALAKTNCWGAKVHEDGTLELYTHWGPTDKCSDFIEAFAQLYETVLLQGSVVSKA